MDAKINYKVWLILIAQFATLHAHGIKFTGGRRHHNGSWNYLDEVRWGESYPTCFIGRRQSPIHLAPSITEFDPELTNDPLRFDNYRHADEQKPRLFPGVLFNSGRFVAWMISDTSINDERLLPRISGGRLGNWFILDHITLHWGEDTCRRGSDHVVGDDYASAPVEIHFVHFNAKYKTFSEAGNKPDGLAVVAFLVKALTPSDETGKTADADFSELVTAFENVQEEGEHHQLYLNLAKLLPFNSWRLEQQVSEAVNNNTATKKGDLFGYYRYSGSLTMPPCVESVTWTVFAKPLFIDVDQLRAIVTSFRANNATSLATSAADSTTNSVPLINTFRMIQHRHGRRVTSNLRALAHATSGSAESTTKSFLSNLLVVILFCYWLVLPGRY